MRPCQATCFRPTSNLRALGRVAPPLILAVALLLPAPAAAEAPRGYYRHPEIHGDTVVFVAEGDLWRVGAEGGTAQRITSHHGEETSPAISPDGRTLAFTARYEGPRELYTMPTDGGLPERRTYEGRFIGELSWTPDGRLIYGTSNFSTLPSTQLAIIDPADGSRELVPLAQAADGNYDDSGKTLFFTRLAAQGSKTKRYHGGTAQDIWSFVDGEVEAVALTPDYTGTSRKPMWWKGRVYFNSDRDQTMNIWSMNPDGGDLRQHTRHVAWDVKDPELEGGRIVYQLGADLRLYDIASGLDRELPIALTSDFDQMREKWVKKPMSYLTSAHLSADGKHVALTARGEVFVAPVGHGRFLQATRNAGVRYRHGRFLPGGDSLIVLSDESGEVEWWRLPGNGIGDAEQITDDGKVLRFFGEPSPDGKWIAHYDQDQELWLTDVEGKSSKKIDFSPRWGYDGPSWSADSAWIVWSRAGENSFNQIFLYNVNDETRATVTTDRYDSYSASFSPDGKWLYFLSDRHFESLVRSPWGPRQPEPFFDRETKIYAVALQKGQRSPFRPGDELQGEQDDADEEQDEKKDEPKGKKKKQKEADGEDAEKEDEEKDAVKVEIDLDGIRTRLIEIPAPRGNLGSLTAVEGRLFWTRRDTVDRSKRALMTLATNNKKKNEPKVLVEGATGYELSADRKKLLVRKGNDLHVLDASKDSADLESSKVDLAGWTFSMDPREEWRQMFVESWRLERDYFYDPGMHGVDWPAMLDKYLPLVDRVTNRAELSDLQAQMAAELSALHIFVGGGDHRNGNDTIEPGSLGARLTEVDGGFRVDRIYRADPDEPGDLSPLARPGVEIAEGDIVETINGLPTAGDDPGRLLRNQAGRQVRLGVRPGGGGDSRDVIVEAISPGRERELRYDEWEYTRRMKVEEAGGGDIGYVHLRAMGGSNIAEWHRHFYPVYNRKGLIIDVRQNRGGNIDSWILERLMRKSWFYWESRVGEPTWNMQYAFRGHIVALIDEGTASDGEAFAEGFRRLGLGKLIGTRTWGGEIWLTSSNVLVDRGIVTAAEFGVYGPEGEWLIEGHGVDPDIEVDNPPHATFQGGDAQLEAAIEHLRKLIENDPRDVPPAPDYPDKSSKDNRP